MVCTSSFSALGNVGAFWIKAWIRKYSTFAVKGTKMKKGFVLWNFSSALFLNAMLLVLFLGLLVPYQILRSSLMFSSVKRDHIWTQRRNVKFGRRTTYGGHMDKCSCIIVEFAIIFPIHRLQFLGFILSSSVFSWQSYSRVLYWKKNVVRRHIYSNRSQATRYEIRCCLK